MASAVTAVGGGASRAAAHKAAFAEGVRLVLSTWPLLVLAVANEWGGPDSAAKAEWLGDVVVELFDTRPRTEQFELEDTFLDILNAEFSTIAEDDSVPQIASSILRLYRECVRGDLTGVEQLRARYAQASAATRLALQQSAAAAPAAGTEGADDSDDSEGEDDGDDDAGGASMEMDTGDAPAPPPPANPAPEPDADGWQQVATRSRRH